MQPEAKCQRNSKMTIKMLVGLAVLPYSDQNIVLPVLINNPELLKILREDFSDSLVQDAWIGSIQESVDYIKIMHKTCSILFWGTVPP